MADSDVCFRLSELFVHHSAAAIVKAQDSHKTLSDTFRLEVNEMARLHPIDQQWNWNSVMLREN